MGPLTKVAQAEEKGLLPKIITKRLVKRMNYVEEGVKRVERASSIKYPPYYVEPVLTVTSSSAEAGELGILYAMVRPIMEPSGLEIWVELSAPLVIFATKPTIHAVLGHEFLHYCELVRRFSRIEALSDETSYTVFEALYADSGRLLEPSLMYTNKRHGPLLVRLLKKRFPDGLADQKLDEKTMRVWIEKGLPVKQIPPEANVANVPISLVLEAKFDPELKARLDEIVRPGR